MLRTPVPKVFGKINIQFLVDSVVKLGGIGSGTEVKNEINFWVIGFQPFEEIVALNQGFELFSAIFTLVFYPKIIAQQQVFKTFFVEETCHATADKTGRTSDEKRAPLSFSPPTGEDAPVHHWYQNLSASSCEFVFKVT